MRVCFDAPLQVRGRVAPDSTWCTGRNRTASRSSCFCIAASTPPSQRALCSCPSKSIAPTASSHTTPRPPIIAPTFKVMHLGAPVAPVAPDATRQRSPSSPAPDATQSSLTPFQGALVASVAPVAPVASDVRPLRAQHAIHRQRSGLRRVSSILQHAKVHRHTRTQGIIIIQEPVRRFKNLY
jgi:hypothetical protein